MSATFLKKNFAPPKICGGGSNPTYSDELHHGELESVIILPNFLATFFFIATSFSKIFNKILIFVGNLPHISGNYWDYGGFQLITLRLVVCAIN